jgi:ATP-dependent Lhr-like helicase
MHDCLHEATDVEGLVRLLEGFRSGAVRALFRETTEPSPLAHEILNGRPYTFLDDAPLEERRTRAVAMRRGLPETARDLAQLDPEAIARVREEARPDCRDAEELHDLLLDLVVLRPEAAYASWFAELTGAGRAARVQTPTGALWLAAEQRPSVAALLPGAPIVPDVPLPAGIRADIDEEEAAVAAVRGHLGRLGPCTIEDLVERTGLSDARIAGALARLEAAGVVLRGRFDPARADGPGEFCDRRLLARIHRYTTERLRREIEPVSAQDLIRFLLRWQHVAPGTQLEGRRGLLAAIEQLQGFEVAAGAWEASVLPARVTGYRPEWLDELCLSGDVAWARLALRGPAADVGDQEAGPGRGGMVPSQATPVSFLVRANLPWLLSAARGTATAVLPGPGPARDVLECLRTRGALFYHDLVTVTGRLGVEVTEALWDLVARGVATADGFGSVRALLSARARWTRRAGRPAPAERLRRAAARGGNGEGRWALVPAASMAERVDAETLADAVAEQLLARWGVVFRDLVARETLAIPWREVVWALRRLEARGTARGGRFVTGFVGEQFALPEAVEGLRQTRRRERQGETVRIAAVDPLNLVGIVTPGPRVPAVRRNAVVYHDGAPVSAGSSGMISRATLGAATR